jgi:hypothetical protein
VVVTETREVEVEVEVYGTLPDSLTAPLSYPEALPEQFTQKDLWNIYFALFGIIDQANEDRATAGRIASGK